MKGNIIQKMTDNKVNERKTTTSAALENVILSLCRAGLPRRR